MNKNQKKLAAAILSCALISAPQMAISPGIARIATDVFPQYSLMAIQATVMLPCLIIVFASIIGAVFVRMGLVSRKSAVVFGLASYAASGIFPTLFHTEFWQLIVSGILLGIGTGLINSLMTSIMMDVFDGKALLKVSGLQGTFVGIGGLILSSAAGVLVSVVWYGGYIMLIPGAAVLVIVVVFLPKRKPEPQKTARRFLDINPNVIYYSIFASLLFVMTFAAFPNNISSHIQASGFLNYSTIAGICIAINLVGAALSGLYFGRLSRIMGDYVITLAYVLVAAGFAILAIFSHSLIAVIAGAFISGSSQCLASPQGVVSISRYTDPSNSFFATMLFSCICNGLAGFICAPVYTSITNAIAPGDTVFRFLFVAGCALMFGIIFALLTAMRKRRGIA